jgi:hypothetical protein
VSPHSASDQLWSIILAGGEGTRLRSLVHRWLGRPKPKQYCAFVGTRSLFQHTLDRQCVPDMMPLFERLSQAIGGPEEGRALEAIYRNMPAKNFSSDLLQRVPEKLAVVELTGVLWSDWGKTERITETFRRIDRRPAFPLICLDHPFVPLPMTAAKSGLSMTV